MASGLPVVLQDGANTYVYGLDLISRTDSGGVQEYYLYDGLGSTSDLSDGAGNSVASYQYDVFGALRGQTGTSANYWLFTGEQRDADSGMYYLRARYYDPAIGRFLGRDPLPSGNLYAYVGNNPVNRIDPTGLRWATDKEGGFNSYDPEAALDNICGLGWEYWCGPVIKDGWRLRCAQDTETGMVVLCVNEARAGEPLFAKVWNVVADWVVDHPDCLARVGVIAVVAGITYSSGVGVVATAAITANALGPQYLAGTVNSCTQ